MTTKCPSTHARSLFVEIHKKEDKRYKDIQTLKKTKESTRLNRNVSLYVGNIIHLARPDAHASLVKPPYCGSFWYTVKRQKTT